MGSINSSVAKAVPSSVAPSSGNSVSVNTRPQAGPLQTPTGERAIPQVARPETMPDENEIQASPGFGGIAGTGMERESGSAGAPTLPEMNGALFRKGPVDPHYQNEFGGGVDPYAKVNNPPTRGMLTWVKDYINGIATSQDVDNTGFKERHPQQRTSHMRITPPPHGAGYAPETFLPKQQPQTPNTYKFMPQTGTEAYGSGHTPYGGGFQVGRVLNSDAYGAGQTAGGQGGNQYTPAPGPPDTNSTAGNGTTTTEPTWG